MNNIPQVKLGIVAVSRDCFPIGLSIARREAIVKAYGAGLYECPVTVENEKDALAALADVKAAGVNALVVFLGNFGPETPETLLCQKFDGPVMYVAAAEGDGETRAGIDTNDAGGGQFVPQHTLQNAAGAGEGRPCQKAGAGAGETRVPEDIARGAAGAGNNGLP